MKPVAPPLHAPFIEEFHRQFPTLDPERRNYVVAVVGLMTVLALMNHDIALAEKDFLKRLLLRLLDTEESRAQFILDQIIEDKLRVSLGEREFFMSYLNAHCNRSEKNTLLRRFFEMAAADRHIPAMSCVMISRFAKAMGLTFSEYEVARLPHIHSIESKDAGLFDERSFARTAHPYPVCLAFRKIRKTKRLHNISLSGFCFHHSSHLKKQEPVTLIFGEYFDFPAYIVRSDKEGRQWVTAGEFDLDRVRFTQLKELIQFDDYSLQSYCSEEDLNLLALLPLGELQVLRNIPHYSSLSVPHALSLSPHLKHASPSCFHAVLKQAQIRYERQDFETFVSAELQQDQWQQSFNLLETRLPSTIVTLFKREWFQWTRALVQERRRFFKQGGIAPEGEQFLQELKQRLGF